MAIKSIITSREDFTGELSADKSTIGLWHLNTDAEEVEGKRRFPDATGNNYAYAKGNSVEIQPGGLGNHLRLNVQGGSGSYLSIENGGEALANIGEKISVGGWIYPAAVTSNIFCPIFSTPSMCFGLYGNALRLKLLGADGTVLEDKTFSPNAVRIEKDKWLFAAVCIETENRNITFVAGNRGNMTAQISEKETFTAEWVPDLPGNAYIGRSAETEFWSGGLDDIFIGGQMAEELAVYFLCSCQCNGGDLSGDIDAFSDEGAVILRQQEDGSFPESGIYLSKAVPCALSGTGKVSVSTEYTAGETSVSTVETSTSDDLVSWTEWQETGENGELQSPNLEYIKFRISLETEVASKTPKLLEIQLHNIPRSPYSRLGYARPVLLDNNGDWEAVLENAFDIVVTGEINGADTLQFSLPYHDVKRYLITNEKQIQISNSTYRIRTVLDVKDTDGATSQIYAEATFYDLAYSEPKAQRQFTDEPPRLPMAHALQNTGWTIGQITVSARRTWNSTEKNALAILRDIQSIYGGDLVFDSANRIVHLLAFSGEDSGASFTYRKNLKSVQRSTDTKELVTRLYAVGADGMTFASVNGGKDYVEDYTYSSEVRAATLDCSGFSDKAQMLEYTKQRLAEYAAPRISYTLNAMDLSVLTDYAHESWDLGDIVTVQDEEMDLNVRVRIVRREYYLQEPWKTVLELSTTLRELGSGETSSAVTNSGGDEGLKQMAVYFSVGSGKVNISTMPNQVVKIQFSASLSCLPIFATTIPFTITHFGTVKFNVAFDSTTINTYSQDCPAGVHFKTITMPLVGTGNGGHTVSVQILSADAAGTVDGANTYATVYGSGLEANAAWDGTIRVTQEIPHITLKSDNITLQDVSAKLTHRVWDPVRRGLKVGVGKLELTDSDITLETFDTAVDVATEDIPHIINAEKVKITLDPPQLTLGGINDKASIKQEE